MQIDMKQPILDKNDKLAKSNRELFAEKKVFVLDLLASRRSKPRALPLCRSTRVGHATWKAT